MYGMREDGFSSNIVIEDMENIFDRDIPYDI